MSHVDVLANNSAHSLVMPISVARYHEMMAAGFIPQKTELIEGIIFRKMTKSPLHEYLSQTLFEFFQAKLDDRYLIRKEAPLMLQNSELEPDISIVKGHRKDFIKAHPQTAELVIEVAVSSIELDQAKADVYAAAGIPEYWIVVTSECQVERYQKPIQGRYQSTQRYGKQDTLVTFCGSYALSQLFSI